MKFLFFHGARSCYTPISLPARRCCPAFLSFIPRRGSRRLAPDGRSVVVLRKIPFAREHSIPRLNTDVAIVRANGSDSGLIVLNFYVMYLLPLLLSRRRWRKALPCFLSSRLLSLRFTRSCSFLWGWNRDLERFQRVMEFPLATRRRDVSHIS